MSIEQFESWSLTIGISVLIGWMLLIIWKMGKESQAGKWGYFVLFLRCAPGRAKRGRVVRGSRASRGVEPLWAGGVCRTAGRPRPAAGEAAGRIRAVPEGRERDWEVLSRHTEGRRTRALGLGFIGFIAKTILVELLHH